MGMVTPLSGEKSGRLTLVPANATALSGRRLARERPASVPRRRIQLAAEAADVFRRRRVLQEFSDRSGKFAVGHRRGPRSQRAGVNATDDLVVVGVILARNEFADAREQGGNRHVETSFFNLPTSFTP